MRSIFILILIATMSTGLMAQDGYKVKIEKDGVTATYNWRPSDKKDPNSKLELDIVLKNNNDYFVKVGFSIAFLQGNEVMEESGEFDLCIKPGKTLKGRKYGLCIISESTSNEEIQSDDFEWNLAEFQVTKVGGCN